MEVGEGGMFCGRELETGHCYRFSLPLLHWYTRSVGRYPVLMIILVVC